MLKAFFQQPLESGHPFRLLARELLEPLGLGATWLKQRSRASFGMTCRWAARASPPRDMRRDSHCGSSLPSNSRYAMLGRGGSNDRIPPFPGCTILERTMSLSVAKTWVQKAVKHEQAQAEAIRLFEEIDTENVDGTLIVGSGLSVNGRCYLVRWDGEEFVIFELAQDEQRQWGIDPHGLFRQLHAPAMEMRGLTRQPLVGLADVQFDAPTYDGWTPLTGKIRFETTELPYQLLDNVALRIKYFRPDLARAVTSMWYADAPLLPPSGELRFRFPALFSDENPSHVRGPLIVFLQMFAADDWVKVRGCRKISNVTVASVTLV